MSKFNAYASIAEADDGRWLEKILLWFQAERTSPNERVIENSANIDDFNAGEIIRFADYLAWPSDYKTWRRVISWIIAKADGWPPRIIAATIRLFHVWQNALSGLPNETSTSLLELSYKWLCSVEEERHPEDFRNRKSSWEGLSSNELENLEKELRDLVVAGHSNPEIIARYLTHVSATKRLGRPAIDQVIRKSAHLPSNLHAQFVDYLLTMTLETLPEDALREWEEREARAREITARERERLEGVPEEELNFSERMSLASPRGIRPDFGMYEEMRLCLNNDGRSFFPPSPIREPFKSLLKSSPSEGLRLIRELTNHAMECWRQLRRMGYRRDGTYRPLELEFPWGAQRFWGTETEYLWFRGMLGPQVLECALPALEDWAFERAEAGDPVDEIIRDVVEGHDCIAVLGIACSLAVASKHVSAVTLPLVTCQRLWHYEIHRSVQDLPGSPSQLIGFSMHQHEKVHIAAIRRSAERPSRRITIRELLLLFVLGGDEELTSSAVNAVLAFPENLPFTYEEEAQYEDRVADLRETAEIWAELAKRKTYRVREAEEPGKLLIEVENPKSNSPEVLEKTARSERAQAGILLHHWASQQFESGPHDLSQRELKHYLSEAKRENAGDLLRERGIETGMLQAGVAAVTALAVIRCDLVSKAELDWARSVIEFAEKVSEPRGEPFIEHGIISWHPSIFAARAIAADLKRKPGDAALRKRLLRLVIHPLASVADAALASAFDCFDNDPAASWAALDLALRLTPQERTFPSETRPRFPFYPEPRVRKRLLNEVYKLSKRSSVWKLPRPPEAWGNTGKFDSEGAPVQREPTTFLRWDRLERIANLLNVEKFIRHDDYRAETLNVIRSWLDWLIAREAGPSGVDRGRYHRSNSGDVFKLRIALAGCLRRTYDELSVEDARAHSLEVVLSLEDKFCSEVLSSMVGLWVAGGVYDAIDVQDKTLEYLNICLERVLKHNELQSTNASRRGEIHDFNLTCLIRDYFFISVKDAPAATRFANGNWEDMALALPFAKLVVEQAGWAPSVASSFMSMCEAGREHLPVNWFADCALVILSNENIDLLSFDQFDIPARLATLVQQLADESPTLPISEASKLLRILDRLVDLGDRRSAALQLSPAFRNITLDNAAA